MKKTFIRFVAALTAVFLVGCSYASESFPLATYYTIRYFDDATPTPKECGYAYFLPGQTAIFQAESAASEYGSAYAYQSAQIAPVGHHFVFDGWYFQDSGGVFTEKANLYNISEAYIDAHGIDLTPASSSDSLSSEASSSLDVSSTSLADGASSGKNYSIATKELRVYAHFVDRLFSLTTQYLDGVNFARDGGSQLLTQTITFGAGSAETVEGYAYLCPHCHHIEYGASLGAGSAISKDCPKCNATMDLTHDFTVPAYSVLSETDFFTETGAYLDGHPDYGYLSDFQGWSLQNDFVDADSDGKPDAGYDPAVFTAFGTGVSFSGDAAHSSTSLPDLSGHVTGDLFLDGHIDAITLKPVNDLYCFVKPTSGDKWVKIATLGITDDSVMTFVASYATIRNTFTLKCFSGLLADGITEAEAAVQSAVTDLGPSYAVSKEFRSKILFTVTGFGSDVTTTAISYDEVDGGGLPVSPVNIPIPNDLFADTSTIEGVDLAGFYYGDETVLPQYRGAPIVISKTPDVALNQVSFLVKSLDGPGYLSPVFF